MQYVLDVALVVVTTYHVLNHVCGVMYLLLSWFEMHYAYLQGRYAPCIILSLTMTLMEQSESHILMV